MNTTRAIVSISLANLCYLRIWDLLLYDSEASYFAKVPYGRADFTAALLGLGLLATMLYAGITVLTRSQSRVLRAMAMLVILVVFFVPLDFARRSSGPVSRPFPPYVRYLALAAVAIALFVLALTLRQRFFAALFAILVVLSPYAMVSLAMIGARLLAEHPPGTPDAVASAIPPTRARPAGRVIWIIYDESDQRILFERRPPGLPLPNLDAFVRRSVLATRAYAPAQETRKSIPALLSGRVVAEARIAGPSELLLRYPGRSEWYDFRSSDNIIARRLSAGSGVVVAGWLHPYDRILPASPHLTAWSCGFSALRGIQERSLAEAVLAQYRFLADPFYGRAWHCDSYANLHATVMKAAADPAVALIFAHYVIPHTPGIYCPMTRQLSARWSGNTSGYLKNLALLDRSLGELLRQLEKSGLKECTSLVVTSDHWWRQAPWVEPGQGYPVPLIIRARGGGESVVVDVPICTTCLRGIIEDLLDGVITDNAGVAERLAGAAVHGTIRYVDGVVAIDSQGAPGGAERRAVQDADG